VAAFCVPFYAVAKDYFKKTGSKDLFK